MLRLVTGSLLLIVPLAAAAGLVAANPPWQRSSARDCVEHAERLHAVIRASATSAAGAPRLPSGGDEPALVVDWERAKGAHAVLGDRRPVDVDAREVRRTVAALVARATEVSTSSSSSSTSATGREVSVDVRARCDGVEHVIHASRVDSGRELLRWLP